MKKEAKLTLRIEGELNEQAKFKCQRLFGIGVSTFIKLFLKSFVSQNHIGFYVGDDQFSDALNCELRKKRFNRLMRERRKTIRADKRFG